MKIKKNELKKIIKEEVVKRKQKNLLEADFNIKNDLIEIPKASSDFENQFALKVRFFESGPAKLAWIPKGTKMSGGASTNMGQFVVIEADGIKYKEGQIISDKTNRELFEKLSDLFKNKFNLSINKSGIELTNKGESHKSDLEEPENIEKELREIAIEVGKSFIKNLELEDLYSNVDEGEAKKAKNDLEKAIKEIENKFGKEHLSTFKEKLKKFIKKDTGEDIESQITSASRGLVFDSQGKYIMDDILDMLEKIKN